MQEGNEIIQTTPPGVSQTDRPALLAKSTRFDRENRGNQPKGPGPSAPNARKRSVIFGMVNETLNGMVHDVHYGKTVRKSYARHKEVLEMP